MLAETDPEPEVLEFQANRTDLGINQLALSLLDLVEQNRRVRLLGLLLGGLHEGCD
jgi:hypothetical protein